MAGNRSYQRTTETNREQTRGSGLTDPLVSVVIPVHNGAKTIGAALDSVLQQKLPLEILVIDDASEDGLEKVVQPYEARGILRYFRNDSNRGVADSRNRGVAEARGSYVAFLDADDYWAPDKLEKQWKVMQEQHCVLCSTGRELLTPEGIPTGRIIGVNPVITYHSLLRHNCINCSSVLMERQAALEFPMQHADSHEDYITWLKVLRRYGTAVGIDEPLLKYRLSATGKSGAKWKSAAMTFKVYRYMGFGFLKSLACFCSYAVHGMAKYGSSYLGHSRKKD